MTLRTETLCFQDFQAAFPDSIIFLNILVDLEGFVISDVSENGCSYYNTHINGNQETGEMQCHLSWLGQKRQINVEECFGRVASGWETVSDL